VEFDITTLSTGFQLAGVQVSLMLCDSLDMQCGVKSLNEEKQNQIGYLRPTWPMYCYDVGIYDIHYVHVW
jgi:hypothetical protein